MLLLDANILIYAFRRDLAHHSAVKRWLEQALAQEEPLAVHEHTALAFLRITTNRRAMAQPSGLEEALQFLNALRSCAVVRHVQTGPEHEGIFHRLCREQSLSGNDITDAFVAAVALEAGATLASTDAGFARFGGLRWLDPLAQRAG